MVYSGCITVPDGMVLQVEAEPRRDEEEGGWNSVAERAHTQEDVLQITHHQALLDIMHTKRTPAQQTELVILPYYMCKIH